jgi:hypothetical protein
LKELFNKFCPKFYLYHWARLILLPRFGCVLQLRKTENNIEVLRKHHLFQSEKNLLGLKPLFVRSKPYNPPSFPEMKSKSDSNPIAGKWI